MKQWLGRVLECWSVEDTHGMDISTQQGRVSLRFANNSPRNFSRGTLVDVRVSSLQRIEDVRVLATSDAWVDEGDGLRWHHRTHGLSRLERLRLRHVILRELRADLDANGFVEINTPLRVRGTCPDVHLDTFLSHDHCLVTSTEYQLKRLLVGGLPQLYSLTQNFRKGDSGERHNSEFTMLEWARLNVRLDTIEDDAERMIRRAAHIVEGAGFSIPNTHAVTLHGARWERLTVREALARYAQFQIDDSFSLQSLRSALSQSKLEIPTHATHDPVELLSAAIDAITPQLGRPFPVFLREWPAIMTPSAARIPNRTHLAERSELFIAGLEIADGFPSLTDPALQRETFRTAVQQRTRHHRPAVSFDTAYLSALDQGLGNGAGMAMGIDRLAMVLLGATSIREVIAFADDEL